MNTLRGVAIIVVFFHHYFTACFFPVESVQAAALLWPEWTRSPGISLFSMVYGASRLLPLFFIISGYFLHRSFLSSRARTAGESWSSFSRYFLWRRFWRLAPPFLVALLVSYFLAYSNPFSAESLRKLAVNATLLKTLFPGYFYSINYAHWYVAVEWQLSLLYPVLLWWYLRKGAWTALAMAWVLCVVFRFVVPQFTTAPYLVNLPFRWWIEWTLGAVLAELHARDAKLFKAPWIFLGVFIALGFVARGFELGALDWLATTGLLALVVESAVLSRSEAGKLERLFAPVGLCSYSIFLFHIPLIEQWLRWFRAQGGDPRHIGTWLLTGAVLFLVTTGFSWLSFVVLERTSEAYGKRGWTRFSKSRVHV